MVLVIYCRVIIILQGNSSFANDFSHFRAWRANSCGSGVVLMPAELPVQWQCVLCQETIGRQSASPHETQCSSGLARVYSRRPGAGDSFYNSCLASSLLPPPPPPAAAAGQRNWKSLARGTLTLQPDWDQGCDH